jgi:hypothetical protein
MANFPNTPLPSLLPRFLPFPSTGYLTRSVSKRVLQSLRFSCSLYKVAVVPLELSLLFEMSSQALQVGDNPASLSFVQQGQIDWVAFANSTVKASVSVMQRFSAAGVQPVTFAGGLALGSRFELGKKGMQNMDVALKNLSGAFGFDKLLYYGFGYRSFVNVLTETKAGVKLVALCACLVDTHSVPIAAEVLAALWKLEAFPVEFEPSMSQYNALVTACAGVVAATVFGQIGDMMLGDLRKQLRLSSRSGLPRGSISSSEDIAKALHGLFQISRGTHERIEILGGPNCSFIGSFAHWLLNLTVQVEDDVGTLIYSDVPARSAAQVNIRYRSMYQLSTELTITSTTFVLRDHDMLFGIDERYDGMPLHVRTAWDGCLKRVFWSSAQRLIDVSRTLGEFLGSAARVYAALARGEPDVGRFRRIYFGDFIDGTYGQGFVDSVGSIFPELGRLEDLRSAMLRALSNSFEQSLTNLQKAISSLASLCECGFCSGRAYRCLTNTQGECEETYCVLVIAMTIASLVRLVASLEIHRTINPTISGLQQIYGQCDRRIQVNGRARHSPLALENVLGLNAVVDDFDMLSPGHLIADVQCLFTGCTPSSEEKSISLYRTASSFNGICCYIEALHGLSSNAAALRRIHVLPGRIRKGDREYSEVKDFEYQLELLLPKATLDTKSITLPTEFREDIINIKAVVRENTSGSGLQFSYEAAFQGTLARIHPGIFTQRVLRRTGLITCSKRTCGGYLVFPCSVIKEGWSELPYTLSREEQPTKCLIWPFRENDFGRCVAIGTAPIDEVLYVRKGECLPCCTKAVANEPFSVII